MENILITLVFSLFIYLLQFYIEDETNENKRIIISTCVFLFGYFLSNQQPLPYRNNITLMPTNL